MIYLNRKTLLTGLTVMALLIFGLLTVVQAAEFSANMEIKAKGKVVARGKIFIQDKLSRTEMNQAGRQLTIINRPDKGVMWSLMPQGKTYMEMALEAEENEGYYSDNLMKELKQKGRFIGNETVNNIACKKYELNEDGHKSTYWIAEKENVMVRIVADENEINYTNIKIGRQPKHLFRPPAGYRKFAMPKMPNGMGGMPMPSSGPR